MGRVHRLISSFLEVCCCRPQQQQCIVIVYVPEREAAGPFFLLLASFFSVFGLGLFSRVSCCGCPDDKPIPGGTPIAALPGSVAV